MRVTRCKVEVGITGSLASHSSTVEPNQTIKMIGLNLGDAKIGESQVLAPSLSAPVPGFTVGRYAERTDGDMADIGKAAQGSPHHHDDSDQQLATDGLGMISATDQGDQCYPTKLGHQARRVTNALDRFGPSNTGSKAKRNEYHSDRHIGPSAALISPIQVVSNKDTDQRNSNPGHPYQLKNDPRRGRGLA